MLALGTVEHCAATDRRSSAGLDWLRHGRIGPQLEGIWQPRRSDDHGASEQAILTDPQTSGGLLVACAPEAVDEVLECFRREGFQRAAVIGEMEAGEPGIVVE